MIVHLKRLWGHSPVVGAGLSFLVYAVLLIPLARLLESSVIMAAALDSVNDGVFFLIGGLASLWLAGHSRHWLNCYARESLELAAMMFGIVSYTLGIMLQPSTETSFGQLAVGLTFGPIGIALNLYWHRRVEAGHDDHEGFSWHLLADLLASAALIPCGCLAYWTGDPRVNLWGAVAVLIATVLLAVVPARRVLARVWHRPADHDCADHPSTHREGSY